MITDLNYLACRASDFMVHALPESSSPYVYVRMTHNIDLISELFGSYYPEFNQSGVKTSRIGKGLKDKPRPQKVILNSEHVAQQSVSIFPHDPASRANTKCSSVMIGRHKTPQEQKYLKSLKEEFRERKSNGEENLTIKFKNNFLSLVKVSKYD